MFSPIIEHSDTLDRWVIHNGKTNKMLMDKFGHCEHFNRQLQNGLLKKWWGSIPQSLLDDLDL